MFMPLSVPPDSVRSQQRPADSESIRRSSHTGGTNHLGCRPLVGASGKGREFMVFSGNKEFLFADKKGGHGENRCTSMEVQVAQGHTSSDDGAARVSR